MTDYCNSACQRHRPAATTNQYTPGHSQTHTNTSKRACATHVCQWARVHGHAQTYSGHTDVHKKCSKTYKQLQRCPHVCTLTQDRWSHTKCTHQVRHEYVQKSAHAHTITMGSGGIRYELQPHTESNNPSVLLQSKMASSASPFPPLLPSSWLTSRLTFILSF